MSQELVLFDLPGKQGNAWSPNTWKTRALLNFKKLPYRTEWIEYPELAPKFKEVGIPPNPEPHFAPYTVPVVQFSDGSYVMDSVAIAKRIIAEYPEPNLPFEDEILKDLTTVNGGVLNNMFAIICGKVRREILLPGSEDWFKQDRERRFGMPEDQADREMGGEAAWEKAKPAQEELAAFLTRHKRDEGPFITGSKPCYPDLVSASWAEFAKCMGDDVYERYVGPVKGLRELHVACAPWLERNTY